MEYHPYYPQPLHHGEMYPQAGFGHEMTGYEDERNYPFFGSLATGIAGGLIGGLLVPGLYGGYGGYGGYGYPYPYYGYGGYGYPYGYYGGYGYGPW